MTHSSDSTVREVPTFHFDLGSFEGFNFKSQSAIERRISAAEIVAWDHDREGEAEFWAAGDRAEVSLVFKGRSIVTGSALLELDALLHALGGDSMENFSRIYYAVGICGCDFSTLSAEGLEENCLNIYLGDSFLDLRKQAAYELFELYYPEEYAVWEKTLCDGLIFDVDRFLDSPNFGVDEVTVGEQKALLVFGQ